MRLAWIVACAVVSRVSAANPDVHPTVEAQLGAGDVHGTCREAGCSSNAFPEPVVGGSLGWWVTRTLVVQLRVLDWISREGSSVDNLVLLGPGVQYWSTKRVWLGAAAGADIVAARTKTDVAAGLEVRAGFVVLVSGTSALSVSADISAIPSGDHLTTFALLLGYQYL